MKNAKKIIGLTLVLVMILSIGAMVTSCSRKENGTYDAPLSAGSLELKNGEFSIKALTIEVDKGTYTIKGDKITFKSSGDGGDFEGTYKDGKVTILGVTYTKK